MKKLLISTAAVALLFGTAIAAPGDNDNNNDKHKTHETGRRDNTGNGPATPARNMQGPATTMQGPGANNTATNNANQSAADRRKELNQNAADKRKELNQNAADKRQELNQNAAQNRQDRNQNAADNRQDRNQNAADNRQDRNQNAASNRGRNNVDLTRYHRNFTASKRFHAQAYRAPRGYHYQRWTYGQRLPSIYWARNYWLTDFLTFGLIAPPDGYVWVRYGDDALLIDEYTGDIVQVEYDVFY